MQRFFMLCLLAAAANVPLAGAAWANTPGAIAAAVASPDRPAADTARDAARKPEVLIAFAGIKPGDTVADLVPGKGYYTRIFSKVVGQGGHVFAVTPSELLHVLPKAEDAVKQIAAQPAFANVTVVTAPTASLAVAAPVDVAWTSDNYHDVYGFFGADQAAAFDAAVFRMLKPGGVFMVIDHVATAGSSGSSPTKLHRIDPATVKAQVLAAGFTLAGESNVLRNPADTHELIVFSPAIRGKTDQFVMKFVKPGG